MNLIVETEQIMKQYTEITLVGSSGRMGQAIVACTAQIPGLTIAHNIDDRTDVSAGEEFVADCDLVIDFSSHTITPWIAKLCAQNNIPLVTGTTGHTSEENGSLSAYANVIPIVKSTNYSTGVNMLFWLTRKTAEILGPDFDLEIIEAHHSLKKDAPSGTAKTLLEILADVRNLQVGEAVRHGRSGVVGERTRNEIGVHAIRGGDIVGDHTVLFANIGERLELSHKASNRNTFAKGALRAAQWVIDQKPGLYSMQDVLGLTI